MGKLMWVAVLGCVIGYSLPGHAEGNGKTLLGQCAQALKALDQTADQTTVDFGDAGRCMGLIDGFAGAAAFYESQPGSPGAICFPSEGATIRQSIHIVDEYLQGHPEQLQEPATVLIFGAFMSAYPCLKN